MVVFDSNLAVRNGLKTTNTSFYRKIYSQASKVIQDCVGFAPPLSVFDLENSRQLI